MNSFRQLRHTLLALLAVLCLLGLQLGAAAHELSHVGGDDSAASQKHVPHAKHCDKCTIYAEVAGGTAATAHPAFALPATGTACAAPESLPVLSIRAALYSARAPPLSA